MLWYEALAPAVLIALTVRLEAKLFLPYWSWLQLIPELGTTETPGETRLKRRSLAKRLAIPLVTGLLLVSLWPGTYGVVESGLVAVLGAGLLLWPLLLAQFGTDVLSPPWLAWFLYGLLPLGFWASGSLGAIIADAIRRRGGFPTFLADEALSLILSGIVLLFAGAATDRLSQMLRVRRDLELEAAEDEDAGD